MAAYSATSISATSLFCSTQVTPKQSGVKSVSFSTQRASFPSFSSRKVPRFQVSCAAAKPETVDKVCDIVRKQLALANDAVVSGDSKFSALGADSLDTVEIVMGLEEAFDITVEEESAQTIETVQDAANMIETLLEKNT